LAEANPAAYLPDLASSVNNLGNRLSEVGRREEALVPAEEAVTINRGLAEANPAAYLPGLAVALGNLAIRLSKVGRRQDALVPAEEAMIIYRGLAEADPAVYLPELAMSLWAIGRICATCDIQLETGLAAAEEAVVLYTELALRLPSVFERPWRAAQSTRAELLDALGRADEAAKGR
jgi:tetratricopeptide (TPR) repeat protein